MVDPTGTTESTGARAFAGDRGFRNDIGRLIDEQVATNSERLLEVPAPLPPIEAVDVAATPPHAPLTLPEPARVAVVPTVAMGPLESESMEPRPRMPTPPRPSPKPREPASVAAAQGRLDDPRQRLEALAKLLDRRVKQSAGNPGDSSTGLDDD